VVPGSGSQRRAVRYHRSSVTPDDDPTTTAASPGGATAADEQRADRRVEIAAVLLLGAGTLLAAWSGYQSAIWNGIQSDDYARGAGQRVEAARYSDQAGQERLYDNQVFGEWLDANDADDVRLKTIYERRFRPEFMVAFEAWLQTDPAENPGAPPGPMFMPEYVQASAAQARDLEAQAAELIAEGETANDDSDHYVLFTVVFATVLFLAAIAERFSWRRARIGVLGIAGTLLVFGAIGLAQLPIG
jgi:hypothetical protein